MEGKIITISSESLQVAISTIGAELQYIKKDGKNYLWEGDPDIWAGKAPLMFPICGGLKEDKYLLDGTTYQLPKHGYARKQLFELSSLTQTSASFVLKSNEESKKMFPFDYQLEVSYNLIDNKIEVKYVVKNLSDKTMYCSIGGHEGYACSEGIEEYSLCFEKKEHLTSNVLNGNLLTNQTLLLGDGIDELPLKYDYFKVDALTLLNLKSRSITLKHKSGKECVKVDFDGFDYVFLWTKPNANYICIEPWSGIPDFEGTSYDITKKLGISKIEKDKVLEHTHYITIEP